MEKPFDRKKGDKLNQNVKVGIIIVVILVIISFIVALMLTSSMSLENISLPGASAKKNVALIKIEGAITTQQDFSLFAAPGAVSDQIVSQIEQANEDDSIEAIMFEINSPGGTVVASEEIANAVKKTEKPTVAFIRELGASGGYWVASAADHIIADPFSITGSIGVLSTYLNFADLLKRYNITYEELKGGKYKDIGSSFRRMRDDERALLQQRIDMIHQAFIAEVAQNRNFSYEYAKEISTGIFYLGSQAKELGLVDELGGKDDVDEYLKEMLNATEISYVQYIKPPGFLEALAGVMSKGFFYAGKGLAAGLVELEESRVQNMRILV
jgi:protease-4